VQRQYAFAAHIRDPDVNAAPADVEDRRMKIYRELFYNNVEGFLASGFPVLRRLMDDRQWHAMARDFFANHRSHSPLFLEISREFLNYLDDERGERPDDPPFLRELAHYEWVELALSVAEAEPEVAPERLDRQGDLLQQQPVFSPLCWALSYRFPVHRIGPDYRPLAPGDQPTYLLVYRNRDDDVLFVELNPVSARLFELLHEQERCSGLQALQQIASELEHPDPDTVIEGGRRILEQWRQRGIVLGTRQ
jgi:hypothetical protein